MRLTSRRKIEKDSSISIYHCNPKILNASLNIELIPEKLSDYEKEHFTFYEKI